MLWVQQVDVLYTKASRGAPAATTRNRLPRAFPMQVSMEGAFAFEHYRLLEWADYVPKLEDRVTGTAAPRSQGDLVIDASSETVTLGLRWNQSIGQPARHHQPRALTLARGQTARLIINGRYTNYSGQFYTEATYNVAFGDALSPDVFERAREAAVFDMRADLF